NFDTVLGFYTNFPTDPGFCDDAGANGGDSVRLDATSVGTGYYVQVGGCVSNTTVGCGASQGTVVVRATTPPPQNGNRAAAQALTTGLEAKGDNFGTTSEPGEIQSCQAARGTSPVAFTAWWSWHAPAPGTAVFTANGQYNFNGVVVGDDTVLAVYQGGGTTPLKCDRSVT